MVSSIVSLLMIDEQALRARFDALDPHLDERQRRLFAASEAKAAGWGGIVAVAGITGRAPSTIGRGLHDLTATTPLEPGRVRRKGGGRKSLVATNPELLKDLNGLVEPGARGDPMSPLRWTCKSLSRLVSDLAALGYKIGCTVLAELLKAQGSACRRTARRWKAQIIPIGMRSSPSSMPP